MRWYYREIGAHMHVRVFYQGSMNGILVFSLAEFAEIQADVARTAATKLELIKDEGGAAGAG